MKRIQGNMNEVLALLNSSDDDDEIVAEVKRSDKINVVYVPPDVHELSDEEEIDDEVIDSNAVITNICGKVQLEYGNDEIENTNSDNNCEPPTKKFKSRSEYGPANWRKRQFNFSKVPVNVQQISLENITQKLGSKSPIELFELFLTDEMVRMIADYSNIYAGQKNELPNIQCYEIKRFIGILFLSGYHTLPQWKLYWSNRPTTQVSIVKNSISRARFETIKRFIHLSNNISLDTEDKFSKVRPFVDKANMQFMQFGVFSHNLSIDEQMIPYFGRHSCKMFIKGKPIRFGFKAWCLCDSNGYLYQTMLYGGASTPHDKTVGLGADVVLSLIENISSPENHRIYFDNFFTSYHLMCILSEKGYFATGTVRHNRVGGATLPEKMKKGEYVVYYDRVKELVLLRWKDNANVTVLSNNSYVEPLASARRYDRSLKKYMNIQVPLMIKDYNSHMGGVDLHDNAIGNYRINIRSKKWWWAIFVNTLSNIMVNAWKIHVLISKIQQVKPMSQLEFRDVITNSLLLTEKPLTDGENIVYDVYNLSHLDITNHFVAKFTDNKRKRCKVCHSKTLYFCQKCNVSLHPKCFSSYISHK